MLPFVIQCDLWQTLQGQKEKSGSAIEAFNQ
jgi:hypothetical protein